MRVRLKCKLRCLYLNTATSLTATQTSLSLAFCAWWICFSAKCCFPSWSLLPSDFVVAGSAFFPPLSLQCTGSLDCSIPYSSAFSSWHYVLPQFRCFSCFCFFWFTEGTVLWFVISSPCLHTTFSWQQCLDPKETQWNYYSRLRSRWIVRSVSIQLL